MLRLVIGLLLVANVVYFAWTQGYLEVLGLAPHEQTEPERLQKQVKPESLRLINAPKAATTEPPVGVPLPAPDTAATASEGTPTVTDATTTMASAPVAPEVPATACWQVGAYTTEQATRLRAALSGTGLASSQWRIEESRTGGRWVVYMGRFNDEQLERKKNELKQMGISFRTLPPPLGQGLALGTYSSEAAAEQGLQDVSKKGVRTARVAQERAESSSWTLILPSATEPQRETVTGLGAVLAGKNWQRCG